MVRQVFQLAVFLGEAALRKENVWRRKAVLWLTKRSFVSPKPQFPQLKMEYSAGETQGHLRGSLLPFPTSQLWQALTESRRKDRLGI